MHGNNSSFNSLKDHVIFWHGLLLLSADEFLILLSPYIKPHQLVLFCLKIVYNKRHGGDKYDI